VRNECDLLGSMGGPEKGIAFVQRSDSVTNTGRIIRTEPILSKSFLVKIRHAKSRATSVVVCVVGEVRLSVSLGCVSPDFGFPSIFNPGCRTSEVGPLTAATTYDRFAIDICDCLICI
jgi:hypothetical protein